MGHYSDYYAEEHEKQLAHKRELLKEQLKDLIEFRLYNPQRNRRWTFQGKVEQLYNEMIKEIKAELYEG